MTHEVKMKLRYIGCNDYVMVHDVVNEEGGRGISLKKGDILEVDHDIAGRILGKFNLEGHEVTMEVVNDEPKMSKKDVSPNKNKMMDDFEVKRG